MLAGIKQFVRVDVAERKTVAAPVKFIIGSDRIAQATGFPYDGQGAVAHGQHLREPAGLKDRGHEQEIRGCIELARQGFIELDERAHFIRMALLYMAKTIFVAGFPCTDDHQLQGHGQNFVGHIEQEVDAFLIGKAADHAEQRKFRIDLQAKLSLQSCFIGRFAFAPVFQSVIFTERTVGRGVVAEAVDPVQDTADFPALCAEDAIQPFPVVIHHDFFSIAGGNGGHSIAEGNARFQEIGHSILKNRRFIHVFFREIKEI